MRMLSPRQLAEALGVSESSLKRWVDAGKITAARTEGGHRKIALSEAVRFIRETNAPVAQPALLDMPEIAVAHERALAGQDRLYTHLVDGDLMAARGWLLSRYLSGASVAELCDGPVREAMHALGELWHHDEAGIFVEHRGTDICLQALAQLRNTFASPANAPLALGATPEDDPYLLPTFMAATVVAAAGLRAVNLGPDTPVIAMKAAVAHHRPALLWISASATMPPALIEELGAWLVSLPSTTRVVIGGRSSQPLCEAYPSLRCVESMQDLATIASEVARPRDHDRERG